MAENRNLSGHTAETGPSPCQEQKPAGEAEPSLGTRLATVQVARHSHDDTFLKTRTINDADAAARFKRHASRQPELVRSASELFRVSVSFSVETLQIRRTVTSGA